MSLPSGLTLVTVTGEVADIPEGAEVSVKFRSLQWLIGSVADQVCPPFALLADVQNDGSFTIQLPATNDPNWSPVGWTYDVTIKSGRSTFTGSLAVPYNAGTMDIADHLVPDVPPESGQTYLLASTRGAAGGVASLGNDGKVPSAQLPAGQGGGAVDSVNGQTGTVVLNAASVGADAAGVATAAVAAHESDTTNVHGIADTAALVRTNDSRLTDSRTPTAHSSSHGSAGSDAVSLNGSQITAGTVAFARLPVGTTSTTVAQGDHTHAGGGTGSVPKFARAIVTSGDIAAPADASWTPLAGLSLTIAAVAGDNVELEVGALFDNNASITDFYELVVVKSGAIARFGSTGTSSPTSPDQEGDPSIYPAGSNRFTGRTAFMSFVAQAADISGGNITFGIAHLGAGGGKIFANTGRPFRWRAINYGQ